jgi:hypothetical protein
MSHFAKIENNIVTEVIVADSAEWCTENLGGIWVQTSYNTFGGVNTREGGEALHKNYAGIGYSWDGIGFAAPKPFDSWLFNNETYLWEPPISMPTDDKNYKWDENNQQWVEVIYDNSRVSEEFIPPTE